MKNWSNREIALAFILTFIIFLIFAYQMKWLGNTKTLFEARQYKAGGSISQASSYSDCVKHVYEDSYKKVKYELHILSKNCGSYNNPNFLVSDSIKFIDGFMDIHIKNGIANTPKQISDEIMAEFSQKYPSLKLTVTLK